MANGKFNQMPSMGGLRPTGLGLPTPVVGARPPGPQGTAVPQSFGPASARLGGGFTRSSPHETRESGEDTVLIGDGGTPYQRYGPNPAESVDPNAAYAAMDDKFSFEVKDTIQRLKPPLPRRQIK
jgi:hypothetical protein